MRREPGRVTLMGMRMKVVAPIALSVGLLGIVGGVAATQAFQPVAKPAQVRLVQPAAQTVTVTPSPTMTTPAPVKTTTAAPKVAKPAPVQSTQAVAPAPRTVQKAAVVSSDTSTSSAPAPQPAPSPSNTGKVITNPDGSTTIQMQPGQQPPVLPPHTPSTTPAG